MKKAILLIIFTMFFTYGYSQKKYDRIVFYDAEIINQDFISIIDSFLVHEEENVTYYTDSMSLFITLGYSMSEGSSKGVSVFINPFLFERFDDTKVYAYDFYKGHKIFLSGNLENPLNTALFTVSNRHEKVVEHFKREIEEILIEDYASSDIDKMIQNYSGWIYYYKDGIFFEHNKYCPCCYESIDCNKKKILKEYNDDVEKIIFDNVIFKE